MNIPIKITLILIVLLNLEKLNAQTPFDDQLIATINLKSPYTKVEIIESRTGFIMNSFSDTSSNGKITALIPKLKTEKDEAIKRVYFLKFYLIKGEENYNFYNPYNKELKLQVEVRFNNNENSGIISTNNNQCGREFKYCGRNFNEDFRNVNLDFSKLIELKNFYYIHEKENYGNFGINNLIDLKYIVIHKTQTPNLPLGEIKKNSDSNKNYINSKQYLYKLLSKGTQFYIDTDGVISSFAPFDKLTNHTKGVKKYDNHYQELDSNSIDYPKVYRERYMAEKNFEYSCVNYNSLGIEHVGDAYVIDKKYIDSTEKKDKYGNVLKDENGNILYRFIIKNDNTLKSELINIHKDSIMDKSIRPVSLKLSKLSDNDFFEIVRSNIDEEKNSSTYRNSLIHIDITKKQKRASWILINYLTKNLHIPFLINKNVVAHEFVDDKNFGEGFNITEFYSLMIKYLKNMEYLKNKDLDGSDLSVYKSHESTYFALINDTILVKENLLSDEAENLGKILDFYNKFNEKTLEIDTIRNKY